MPHCIIEYSPDLDLETSTLLSAVFAGAIESGLFSENDIKVRALAFNDFTIGLSWQDFIHVNLRILSGRTLEQRKALSQLVLYKLKELVSDSVSISVEITEIEKESYAKRTN